MLDEWMDEWVVERGGMQLSAWRVVQLSERRPERARRGAS